MNLALNTCTTQNLIGTGGLYVSAYGSETTNGSTTAFSVTEHIEGVAYRRCVCRCALCLGRRYADANGTF